ncbi:MAG: hypothetical protein QNJ45_21680 [Ardenticatenaceae bacterium]|nr:hypothetical protein [Ardenticatenaceae bacterium]
MNPTTSSPSKGAILGILVAVLWLIASGLMIATQSMAQINFNGFEQIAGVVLILALIIYLMRTPPNATDMPDIQPLLLPRLGYGMTLLVIVGTLVALFLLGIIIHPWLVVVAALTLIAVGVIIKLRQHLSLNLVIVGLAAGAICVLLSWFSGRLDGFQGFYLACTPILFIGGGLLSKTSGLSHVYTAEGHWGLALKGFLWACVLALPAALLNISFGAHAEDAWVDQLWEPLVAFVPGIAEEIWARLFMTTIIYVLLRPKTNDRPGRALAAAVVIGAFTHSLAHLSGSMVFSPAALQMIIAGILFGVPMGLLFVKRDFEHAVGYHFFIDFVRFFAALS